MPIIDSSALEGGTPPGLLDCDVCIIGSGPAGSTIARELSRSRLRVIILESGGRERQNSTDELNEIENVGRPRVLDNWMYRNRIVGGSSHTWSGRCAPFDAIDFETREWVPYSGWPIDRAHIVRYLVRAAPYTGLAPATAIWSKHQIPQLNPATLLPVFWQFSRDDRNRYDYMRFGPHLVDHLNANLLITNATVTCINAVESGAAVQSVQFAAVNGRRSTVSADRVVLCTGGIENARLLLCSNNVMSCGLGNAHDVVGRFLMDHPRGQIASFRLTDASRLMNAFGYFRSPSLTTRPSDRLIECGIRLSPKVQREEALLNCAAWIGETIADDDPWYSVVRFLRRKADIARDSFNILSHSNLIAHGAYDYFIRRRGLRRKWNRIGLDGMCEQKPDPDSRITLSQRRDRHGMRLARIDWRVHEDEARTMRRIAELAIDQFPRLGLPAPVLDEWARDGAMLPTSFVDVGHPTGATRMSADPRTGVVDANCEVHGVRGLFIAGSSVFPTAGHANPTQMIVALALRLADHLQGQPTAQSIEGEKVMA